MRALAQVPTAASTIAGNATASSKPQNADTAAHDAEIARPDGQSVPAFIVTVSTVGQEWRTASSS